MYSDANGWSYQEEAIKKIRKKGACYTLSNAHHPDVKNTRISLMIKLYLYKEKQ